MSDPLSYPDLGATIYPATVPDDLVDELPGLYSSLCSTVEWFRVRDKVTPEGACVLAQPRHVLLFTLQDGTVEILNKATRIRPDDVERACRALIRAFPHVHRVHLEVMFQPSALRLPHRVVYWADHQIIRLPTTVKEYDAFLGSSTRKSLRKYQNRLRRDFPDIRTEVIVPGDRSEELVSQLAAWKIERFHALGRQVFWETHPHVKEKIVRLLQSRGEVHVTRIRGELAALQLVFPVGDAFYVDQSSFDPRYEHYRLGFVSGYWVACNAIERGGLYLGQMWGNEDFKTRLGARPVRATRISVFPRQRDRFRATSELREVGLRTLRRNGADSYWRHRSALGRRARRLASLLPRAGE